MSRTLPYPPPYQDAPTLCAHLCISEGTLDNWVRQGFLPPCRHIGGKRMWKWSEVEAKIDGISDGAAEMDLANQVREATRKAVDEQSRRRRRVHRPESI